MNFTRIFANGRIVGHVDGNVFQKHVSGSRHFLRQPPAIMFDLQSLADAQAAGATIAKVIDDETKAVYQVDIEKIFEKPIYKNYAGAQVGLRLSEWTKNGVLPSTITPQPTPQRATQAAQPRLF